MEKMNIIVPQAGESVSEAEIASWKKVTGDNVLKDEIIGEIETEKASLEIRSPVNGEIIIKKEVGETVVIGEVIAEVSVSKESEPLKVVEKVGNIDESKEDLKEEQEEDYIHSVPSARKLMQENSINKSEVKASGKGGKIIKEDVLKVIKDFKVVKEDVLKVIKDLKSSRKEENIDTIESFTREEKRVKMTRIRTTIAKRLVMSQQTAALLTTFNEVNMKAIIDLRKKYKETFKEKHQVSLGFMSFFIKAVTSSLNDFPLINSRIENNEVVTPNYCDVGIAVATPKGLVVPILRDVEKKDFKTIEKEIITFAQKGKENKISIEEISGGTFTITNGGTFGSMLSTPIVNYPQSAILGMHNIIERPVAINGEIVIRPIMYLALSYDHRLIDGADAVKFLVNIKQLIEDPHRLLINV